MRVHVRFRYHADTGEVEVFQVEDTSESPTAATAADHDRRHDLATADVARVVGRFPLIEEVFPESDTGETDAEPARGTAEEQAARDTEDRRLRG